VNPKFVENCEFQNGYIKFTNKKFEKHSIKIFFQKETLPNSEIQKFSDSFSLYQNLLDITLFHRDSEFIKG
jgi:hypothetical protein